MSTRWSRRDVLLGGASVAGLAAMTGCSGDPGHESSQSAAPSATAAPTAAATTLSRAPKPRTTGGLHMLAHADGDTLRLHTQAGDLVFWGGVRLTGTLPGAAPGVLSATAAHYRRWFAQMGQFGVPFVQLDRLHPVACYAELARYNRAHAQAPLYLIQGVSLPQQHSGSDLYTDAVVAAMADQISEAVTAVHGSGRTYRTDVSTWLAAWFIDIGWSPAQIAASDTANAPTAAHKGRYISSARGSSPTETWCARMLDTVAEGLAEQGTAIPVAFVNRPETDPIAHARPRTPAQNVSTIDPNHVTANKQWPAGVFALYDAPPYRPDFIAADERYGPDADPYLAYVIALRSVTDAPLMISSCGVTSAWGSGYPGTAGRSQGGHTEAGMFAIEAHLISLLAQRGLAGGLLGYWTDDWSQSTWNTMGRAQRSPLSRRSLVHDALTAEQWGGVVAFDPIASSQTVVHHAPKNDLQRVLMAHDAEWLYLTLEFNGRVTSPVEVGFDILGTGGLRLPGGSGNPVHDVALRTVPTMSTTYLYVRAALDPLQLDSVPLPAIPSDAMRGWHLQRILQMPVPAQTSSDESRLSFIQVGDLRLGNWAAESDSVDTLAGWYMNRSSGSAPAVLRYRLPWGLINMLDASARGALQFIGNEPTTVPARAITMTIESSTVGSPVHFVVSMPQWSTVRYRERVKAGSSRLSDAFAQTIRFAP